MDIMQVDEYDGYPYPDEITSSIATGELAARICIAAGLGSDVAITLTETLSYEGTETTQEQFVYLRITAAGFSREFDEGYSKGSAFSMMLSWLDEHALV